MNGRDKGQRAEGKRQVKKKKRQEMVETVQESAVRSRGERRREGCGGGERDQRMSGPPGEEGKGGGETKRWRMKRRGGQATATGLWSGPRSLALVGVYPNERNRAAANSEREQEERV